MVSGQVGEGSRRGFLVERLGGGTKSKWLMDRLGKAVEEGG